MINLVDLLYCDTIIYIYSTCLILSVALAHTILAGNSKFTLNFEYALLYSMLINFFLNNLYLGLILSGALRLISLLKNSEAAGLQIFGPDNDALQLFRLFSNVISILFSCFAVFELNAYPGMFGLLFVEENQSNVEDIMQNKFVALYLVLPFITVVVNFIVHFYSKKMRRQLRNASSIFVIENAATDKLWKSLLFQFHC